MCCRLLIDLEEEMKMNEPPTVDDVRLEVNNFGVFDYVVFTGMLLSCALIGIYYSFRGKKDTYSAREYLLGGKDMSTLPVAISLVAGCTSGITLLGAPAEVYLHGTEYVFLFIPVILTGFVASYLLLPVFHEMHLFSAFEYLERRFDRNVRFFGSVVFTVTQVFWLPTAVYVPALAFNKVAGVNIHVVIPLVCIICIFYTFLGGLKAVVSTDVLQILFMLVSLTLVCVKGSLDLGGFNEVWQRNAEGGRLVIPTFETDLTIRHSLWALTFGGLLMLLQNSVLDQKLLQKYLSLPSLSHARRALWMFVFGSAGLCLLSSYAGLIIYAFYQDCDPLTTKLATRKEQLLPLLVMRVLSQFPGLPGLFVAGILGSSLSTLSSGLTSLSTVVLEDFTKPFLNHGLSTRATNFLIRAVPLVFGTLFLTLLLTLENLETTSQLCISLASISTGPLLGTFLSGIFLPWVNSKGALFGGLLGLFASGFIIIGAQGAAARNNINIFPKPTSVEGCHYYYNVTILASSDTPGAVFPLFRLSYFWHTAFGGFVTMALAFIISALTGFTDLTSVDPIWFSPVVRSRLPLSVKLKRKEEQLLQELKKIKFHT